MALIIATGRLELGGALLLYENGESIWLGFQDPSLHLPQLVEKVFTRLDRLLASTPRPEIDLIDPDVSISPAARARIELLTEQLNAAGMEHLKYLARRAPVPDSHLFLQTDADIRTGIG